MQYRELGLQHFVQWNPALRAMEQRDWPMKLPSPWHANASVCALAFIKAVAVRQSSLCNQMRCDEMHRLLNSFHRGETRYKSVLVLRP
jgi:hypothetical protein